MCREETSKFQDDHDSQSGELVAPHHVSGNTTGETEMVSENKSLVPAKDFSLSAVADAYNKRTETEEKSNDLHSKRLNMHQASNH